MKTPYRCLNQCNGRGTCMAGWCHCEPGYYGADCSLSIGPDGKPQILAGLGYKPAPGKPKIYIYEVPPRFNTWKNIEKFDRPLYVQLWKRIISSGHRTLDADEADFYYIPVDFRYLFQDAAHVIQYVRETWPYWDRTGGAKHLLLSTSDLGGCEGSQLMRIRNMTANSTWLTAWGLTRKHPRVWWPGCHRPGLDIVIPIPAQTTYMLMTPLNPKAPRFERNITFYFSGKICGDNQDPNQDSTQWPICKTPTNPLYSAGVRQQVYHHHAHRPGFKVVARSSTYLQDMASSKFCLAPTGGGHGKRQVLVARFGCIPVPITDHVLQPFEPELDWPSFSVAVKEEEVPRLHEVLAAISEEKLEKMQEAVACASKHLWWSSMWGGIFGEDARYDAFATVMEILRVRVEHPTAQPHQYAKVDERWRKFAECKLDDEPPQDVQLCSYGFDDALRKYSVAGLCDLRRYGKYGIPGGAICQGAPTIAQCPRPWE
eukprot:CAMPEP_0202896838 /NCGR_PEP_ID=MMETSP1392-20130828/5751_1 /ASSEMBLY_ACC=CAM_ASM_000868 /TAXON_ID=225041 /ORGANISM="Chlamydomonas chlamydogama, Strain SAG 11-48b" /LENGTH=484 /DNA_ID=CAMNT_0049582321 /DNA_START=368 /DNA_END=1822 /DNA_ORIENTATION=+